MTKIILASASPYRKKLLSKIIADYRVVPAKINERVYKKRIKEPEKLAVKLALEKAKRVIEKLKIKKLREKTLVIAADTLIDLDGQIIGKAQNRQEAKGILLKLKNRSHRIMTAIAVVEAGTGRFKTAVVVTKVKFRDFNNNELKRFLDSGDWQGKAGAYGLQLKNFEFLERYEGDYENILGLPLEKLALILKEFGVKMK